MFHRIPPVGNPICWWHSSDPPKFTQEGEQCLLLNSGTAALAAALKLVKKVSHQQTPEVIMPGYACPDIISAAVHAGVTPVLVDLEQERPYMSLQEIKTAINENTIAIVAVNFLGIPERIDDIRAALGNNKIIVIEDSAQWYPDSAITASESFSGDLIVLSFGKGKPFSLLGGGALLVKKIDLAKHIKPASPHQLGALSKLKLQAMLPIYNCLISPLAYWLLEAAPFIEIGATHYKTLSKIEPLDDTRLKLLSENIHRYQKRSITNQEKIQSIIKQHEHHLIDLPSSCNNYAGQRLLRYPLLLSTPTTRNNVIKELINTGTGASPLYPSILPDIPRVAMLVKVHSKLKNARDFSARLITLPTHQGVNDRHITAIEKAIKNVCEN